MKENPLQYRVRGTPVPTTRTRGTNYPESTDGPEHDGAYQLNMARLKRLLDLAEVHLATSEEDMEAFEEADREHTPPEDLAEQIDRILVSNPAH